ncbi:hypothetical protein B7494_g8129 [Chlorociboria aeruginascens]|nr:hypothetical protein B7494_g8129 [Chlorociboria aeruginascens]
MMVTSPGCGEELLTGVYCFTDNHGDLIPRRLAKSTPNIECRRDADGFALPPTPGSTRSRSYRVNAKNESHAPSDISDASTGSGRKSLVEDSSYRDMNLTTNNVYMRSSCEQFPEHITNLVDQVRRDRDSPDLSPEQVIQNTRLAELEMGTAENIAVLEHFTSNKPNFYKPKNYVEFRKYIRNIIDWGKDKRLNEIRNLLNSLLEETRAILRASTTISELVPYVVPDALLDPALFDDLGLYEIDGRLPNTADRQTRAGISFAAACPCMPRVMMEPPAQKAHQACVSCKKQKRRCDKRLPSCSLCTRMNRACDYTDGSKPPTSDDFDALRLKLVELEGRLNGSMTESQPPPFATPSSAAYSADGLGPAGQVYPFKESPWQNVQNRFPAIAFLDIDSFKYGGIAIPKPSVEIPPDVLELLGDGSSVQAVLMEYFTTIHKWMPIVSQKRLTRNMANPLWEAGPDLALLFLSMKLVTSRPQDGIESSNVPGYSAVKRFISLIEAAGLASLLVLQANILVTLFEYGQAIYPAAWMSAGWTSRYMDRTRGKETDLVGIVSIGSQAHILTNQEPRDNDPLPADDAAWDEGDMPHAIHLNVSYSIEHPLKPFPRLCQVFIMMGKVFGHHHGLQNEDSRFSAASQLYIDVSNLATRLTEQAVGSPDYLHFSAPLALAYSTLCALCEPYSCPPCASDAAGIPEVVTSMQLQALDGLKDISRSMVEFAHQINIATPLAEDIDRVNPLIMDALYSAATNYAWMVRESGDEDCQRSLDSIRHTLRRLGTRWRNAAEYLRILEAQEFTYAVGSVAS